MQAHLDMRADQLIAQGAAPEAARAEARRASVHDAHQGTGAEHELLRASRSVTQDVVTGCDCCAGSGFTAVATLVLGLGLGLNAAMFSIFDHVLLSPLPFPDAERLLRDLVARAVARDARRMSSGPDFRDDRDQNTVFSGVAAVIPAVHRGVDGRRRAARGDGGVTDGAVLRDDGYSAGSPVYSRRMNRELAERHAAHLVEILEESAWRATRTSSDARSGSRTTPRSSSAYCR